MNKDINQPKNYIPLELYGLTFILDNRVRKNILLPDKKRKGTIRVCSYTYRRIKKVLKEGVS